MSEYTNDYFKENEFLADDPNYVIPVINKNGLAIEYVSENLKKDPEIAIYALMNNPISLQFLPKELRSNKELIISAIIRDGLSVQYVSEELKSDHEVVLKSLNQNGLALQYVNENLKNNPNIVKAAVTQNYTALQYAHDSLKDNEEFVLEFTSNTGSLEYISSRLKNDENFIKKAIIRNGLNLQYAHESIRNDNSFAMLATSHNGLVLEFLSEDLKNNYDIVLNAVQENAHALEFASETLKDNEIIINEAVKKKISAIKFTNNFKNDFFKIVRLMKKYEGVLSFIGEELRGNRDLALIAMIEDGTNLIYFNENLKKDKTLIRFAINNEPSMIYANFLDDELRNDPEVIDWYFQAQKDYADNGVTTEPILQYLNEKWRNDELTVIKAMKFDYKALEFASNRLKNDNNFLMPFIKENVKILQYAGDSICDNEDIMLQYCLLHNNNGTALNARGFKYVSDRLKYSESFKLSFIYSLLNNEHPHSNPSYSILGSAPSHLLDNKDVALKFVRLEPSTIHYFSENIRNDIYVVYEVVKEGYTNKDFLGKELKEKIGEQSILSYCESAIFADKLHKKLPMKKEVVSKIKL